MKRCPACGCEGRERAEETEALRSALSAEREAHAHTTAERDSHRSAVTSPILAMLTAEQRDRYGVEPAVPGSHERDPAQLVTRLCDALANVEAERDAAIARAESLATENAQLRRSLAPGWTPADAEAMRFSVEVTEETFRRTRELEDMKSKWARETVDAIARAERAEREAHAATKRDSFVLDGAMYLACPACRRPHPSVSSRLHCDACRAEAERDAAVARAESAERERVSRDNFERAIERAETAERERDEARAQVAAMAKAIPALLHECDECDANPLAFQHHGSTVQEKAMAATQASAGAPLLAELARLRGIETAARAVATGVPRRAAWERLRAALDAKAGS